MAVRSDSTSTRTFCRAADADAVAAFCSVGLAPVRSYSASLVEAAAAGAVDGFLAAAGMLGSAVSAAAKVRQLAMVVNDRNRGVWFPPNRGGLSYAAARSGAVMFS